MFSVSKIFSLVKMNSELVKSKSETMDPNNNANETISVRLARYLDHLRDLEAKNTQTFRQEDDTRLVQQQELHAKDLDELREQYETQLQANREQMENLMKTKLKAAEIASQRDKEALEHVLKTLSVTHNQINESESRVMAMEKTKSNLNESVRNLQTNLEVEQFHQNDLLAEVNSLREELALKIEQQQRLVDEEAENSLGLEIAKFNHLLSSEEKRLKLLAS